MAGQLPPDVLEDLMLVEAINGPEGGALGEGVMPGGFGDMQAEMDGEAEEGVGANVVNVNFVPAPVPGAARPPAEVGPVVGGIEEEEEDTDDDVEEEEEYVSVRMLLFGLMKGGC